MCKKTLILSTVCVFIIAGVSVAEDRGPAEEEQELRQRIEKIRAKAHEHEEEAKHLFAESEELERQLEHRDIHIDRDEHIKELLQKITNLRKSADLAEKEGHREKAHELREQAKR